MSAAVAKGFEQLALSMVENENQRQKREDTIEATRLLRENQQDLRINKQLRDMETERKKEEKERWEQQLAIQKKWREEDRETEERNREEDRLKRQEHLNKVEQLITEQNQELERIGALMGRLVLGENSGIDNL